MKYRHYAPQEPVIIVSGPREKAAAYIRAHFTPGDRVLCFEEELPLYTGCAPLGLRPGGRAFQPVGGAVCRPADPG